MPKQTTKRKRSKKTPDDDVPRKKRGNPGDFKGQRLEFLTSLVPEYLEYAKRGKGKNKSGAGPADVRAFWPAFFHDYWEKFDWRLSLDEEPLPLPDSVAAESIPPSSLRQTG
ncbi:hypothetical protein C8R45DRAFT_942597 [Mycena sanguinolenta]|nr:hypothetical protein C8R45DRAFT_942597 [Mycena sanguinolenta]